MTTNNVVQDKERCIACLMAASSGLGVLRVVNSMCDRAEEEDAFEFIDVLSTLELPAPAYSVHSILSAVSECRRVSAFG